LKALVLQFQVTSSALFISIERKKKKPYKNPTKSCTNLQGITTIENHVNNAKKNGDGYKFCKFTLQIFFLVTKLCPTTNVKQM